MQRPKKKKKVEKVEDKVEDEETEEEQEEDEEEEKEEDEEEETQEDVEEEPQDSEDENGDEAAEGEAPASSVQKQQTFAGNRAPAGKDNLELYNIKVANYRKIQTEMDKQNPELKKMNHRINGQTEYWKHMQETIKLLKKDNKDVTQEQFKGCFSAAAKAWKEKATEALRKEIDAEKW